MTSRHDEFCADHGTPAGQCHCPSDPPELPQFLRAQSSPATVKRVALADPTPDSRAGILEAARDCVTIDRNRTYGSPEDSFGAIAEIQAVLDRVRGDRPREGVDVTADMIALKLVRAVANPGHADSWVDIAGYAACGGELAAKARSC